jgi:hypothetical protein
MSGSPSNSVDYNLPAATTRPRFWLSATVKAVVVRALASISSLRKLRLEPVDDRTAGRQPDIVALGAYIMSNWSTSRGFVSPGRRDSRSGNMRQLYLRHLGWWMKMKQDLEILHFVLAQNGGRHGVLVS